MNLSPRPCLRAALCGGILICAVAGALAQATPPQRLSSPSGDRYCRRELGGESVLPNGRILTPYGRAIIVAPFPFGLTMSRNGKMLAAVSSINNPVAVSLVSELQNDTPYVRQFPPGIETDEDEMRAAFMGAAFAPDNRNLYVSGGDDGTIHVIDAIAGRKKGIIKLNVGVGAREFHDSFVGAIALSDDGSRLYAVDQANFRLVIIDPMENPPPPKTTDPNFARGAVVGSVDVGRYPFDVQLSEDGKTAYVANAGMFEYSVVKGINKAAPDHWLPFPAFGFNTPEMREGLKVGELEVPGLGDPNAPQSFSIWSVDVSTTGAEKVTGTVKTGVLIGQPVDDIPAVGGSNPNSIAVAGGRLYVTNGSNDSITVIDAATFKVVDTIDLALRDIFGGLKGQIPFGIAATKDGARLYVCEAGINALAVIDTASRKVVGRIPTAWFPSKVVLDEAKGRLFVACAKGFGAGPNGGKGWSAEPGRVTLTNLMKGVILSFPIPREGELAGLTKKVIDNLVKVEPAPTPVPEGPRGPVPPWTGAYESPIKHVVYITKENRTFDQVFGELEGANGDPTIAPFGFHGRPAGKGSPMLEDVNIMPNHQRLARRFAVSDNFYCDSDYSADGHRWLVGTYPNVWTETTTKTSPREEQMFSAAPGRRLMTGSSGAIYPEDYNQAGSIWEHLHRHGIEFYNFGLGFEFAGAAENNYGDTGIRIGVNYPMPEPLFNRTSRNYATYNTNVPDQVRVNHFEAEFKEKWVSGKEPFPPLVTMMLPNDHGSSEKPARGYPYMHSYMGDNDLALGRVIETLSKSPWWKETAVFVVEDDAQGGQDHVDHHRSICMILGPWAKKGYVSHRHVSFGSVLKTIYLILGLPNLNQFDAAASDLADAFATEPDAAEYHAVAPDPRVFDAAKALAAYDEKLAWEEFKEEPDMDDPKFTLEQRKELEREGKEKGEAKRDKD